MKTITEITICGFDEAWIGQCKKAGNPFCPKHSGRVCVSCGSPATRNCPETGQFVCGENLCNDCEHSIFPSGTNGGIGFNAEPLPEGMHRHCKKTEQRFKPWYAREEEQNDLETKVNKHIMLRCPHCNQQYEAEIGNNPLVKDGLTITPLPIETPLESDVEQ